MDDIFYRQVHLLLRLLPEVAKVDAFALHGGTAINLFYHEMPRLSVDIDLTWIPYGERESDLLQIVEKLIFISSEIKKVISDVRRHSRHKTLRLSDLQTFRLSDFQTFRLSDLQTSSFLSSKRPLHEILDPRFIDQRPVFKSHFRGMTDEPFTYEKFEEVRSEIHFQIMKSLHTDDKTFLKSFVNGNPVWSGKPWQDFPGIRWKLMNIQKLKATNPRKFQHQLNQLETVLSR